MRVGAGLTGGTGCAAGATSSAGGTVGDGERERGAGTGVGERRGTVVIGGGCFGEGAGGLGGAIEGKSAGRGDLTGGAWTDAWSWWGCWTGAGWRGGDWGRRMGEWR